MPSKFKLSKELEALLDEYETSYRCAGSVIWFRNEPTLQSIAELRSFLNQLADDIIIESL